VRALVRVPRSLLVGPFAPWRVLKGEQPPDSAKALPLRCCAVESALMGGRYPFRTCLSGPPCVVDAATLGPVAQRGSWSTGGPLPS
jgi:hypothetical protein